MNRRNLTGLVVLNAALLFVLGIVSFSPQEAVAQSGLRGGDYLMVAGSAPAQIENTVYVFDINNAKMLAVKYDNTRRSLIVAGARDVARDFE